MMESPTDMRKQILTEETIQAINSARTIASTLGEFTGKEDPFELKQINDFVDALPEPRIPLEEVSELLSLCLHAEDLLHKREDAVKNALIQSAVSQARKKTQEYVDFATFLTQSEVAKNPTEENLEAYIESFDRDIAEIEEHLSKFQSKRV